MDYDIQAYVKREGDADAVNTKSLWPDMWLLESKNVAAYGKPKNVVTESFAETDGLRVWTPTAVAHEATDVTLTFCFLDGAANRYDAYDAFVAYVEGMVFEWWDTVRFRKERLLLTEKVEPKEHFHGDIPYIEAEFKFKNVDGKATDMRGYWLFGWSDQLCVKVEGMNNGMARRKTLAFTREDGESRTFSVLAAFGGYTLINDATFAALSDAAYAARLAAFCAYAKATMADEYPDFEGMVGDVTAGAVVSDPVSCPTQ